MKKMKKMLALALAFVLAVTILPMVGSKVEAATVEQNVGYYRWYLVASSKTGAWESVGTPVVKNISTPVADIPTRGNYLNVKDYTKNGSEISQVSVTSQGVKNTYTRLYKMSSNNNLIFTAPCDGTIELYCRPRAVVSSSVNILVNGKTYGESMELVGEATDFKELGESDESDTWKYILEVEKGTEYTISSSQEVGVAQLTFIPSPVSSVGASYREKTDKYENGIRFGSTIDKTKINFGNVTESGTLIARKTTMDSKGVTELTMDSVGKECLNVVRKTYLDDTNEVLNYAAAIVNIPADKLDEQFVARSYVVIDDVTYYGAQKIDTWNSVKAKADKKVEQNI